MIAILMNLLLMSVLLAGSVKAYYEFAFLNQNPTISAVITLICLVIIACVFPRIIFFLIKMIVFSSIVYFVCHRMGWDLSFLKSDSEKAEQMVEAIGENVGDTLNKVQNAIQPTQTFTAKAPPVKTGNRLQIGGETVQLYGIDVPDMEQSCKTRYGDNYRCGELSKKYLQDLIKDRDVSCETKGKNRSGEMVATCSVNGNDLAGLMIHAGWAVADRSVTDKYVEEEKSAHDGKIGLWAGKFQAPWTWRLKHSNQTEEAKELTPFQKMLRSVVK